MSILVILHILNSEPIVGEIDELPTPTDNIITLHNPRQIDGKDIGYLQEQVTTVIWPIEKINFIEIMPGKDGLCHISEIEPRRINKVTDILKEGDETLVKVIEIDQKNGKIRLSRKQALDKNIDDY